MRLAAAELLVDLHISVFFEFAEVGGEVSPGESGGVDEKRCVGGFDDIELGN